MKNAKFGWVKRACALLVLSAAAAATSPAQTFTTLVNFDGYNGFQPEFGSLIQGPDGNLYGTTPVGGANQYGTIFQLTPSGTVTTLYGFDFTDGYGPTGLVLAKDGEFYGTTTAGGLNGNGTFFRFSGGVLTVLYNLKVTDGADNYGSLIQGTDGSFYGITTNGGADGYGTAFKITLAKQTTFTTLHAFELTDGAFPFGGLVQGTDGNFYGTTFEGGADGFCDNGSNRGCGTIFRITPAGVLTTLHEFRINDGASPYAGLIQASDGNFYGTTANGGANGDYGTVFRMTPAGKLTTLYSFGSTGGNYPRGPLMQGTDGNFYGTTAGVFNVCGDSCGSVFEITPQGVMTPLHLFDYTDGAYSVAGLVQATNGTFYGTTSAGGADKAGTVFSEAVGLGPFVEMLPTSGSVGSRVWILGTNLTGTTSVTFNGTAAVFTIRSNTEIVATVPAGAITGPVEVVTPGGTLTSSVPFRVRP
jgi:uncharacterized repeat protein (TIGR03803 family)